MTIYEALEDAGLVDGGGQHHLLPRPHAATCRVDPRRARAAYGPKRFFYYNLFESDVTGAPLAVRTARPARSTRTRPRRPLARDARRLRLPRLLPPGLRLRLARARARTRRTRRSRAATRRSARCSTRPAAGRVPRALRASSSAPTTARRRSTGRRGSRTPSPASTASLVDGVEPRRDGLPPAGCRADAAELARAARRRPGVEIALFREDGEAVARRDGEELRFAPTTTAGGRAATRRCSTIRTGSSAPGRRSRTRTRARCSSRRRPASSSPTSAAGTTSGGGSHGSLTAGDSEVPMLTVGLDGRAAPHHRRRAARARALRRRAAAVRRCRLSLRSGAMVERQLRAPRHRGRARARGDGARAARALRPARRERGRAYDDAALPIGHGQTISQPYMVARDLRGARAARRRARARRRHRLGLPGGGARRARRRGASRSSGSRSSRSRRARRPRRGGLRRASTVHVGDGTLGVPGARAVRRDRGRRRRARAAASALRPARARADGSSCRSAAQRAQQLQLIVRSPEGAGRRPLGAVPLRAARRRGGLPGDRLRCGEADCGMRGRAAGELLRLPFGCAGSARRPVDVLLGSRCCVRRRGACAAVPFAVARRCSGSELGRSACAARRASSPSIERDDRCCAQRVERAARRPRG